VKHITGTIYSAYTDTVACIQYVICSRPRWSSCNVLVIGPKIRGLKPGRGR
jgi:hypothetical protein